MHDLTIDRTTNGQGPRRRLHLRRAAPPESGRRPRRQTSRPISIPRLKDVLEWGKDKVVFNFDNKYINTKGVSDEVRQREPRLLHHGSCAPAASGSMYHNIMLSVRSIGRGALLLETTGIRNVHVLLSRSARREHVPRRYEASPDSVEIHHGLYPAGGQSPSSSRSTTCCMRAGVLDDDLHHRIVRQGEECRATAASAYLRELLASEPDHHRDRLSLRIHRPAVVARRDPRPAGRRHTRQQNHHRPGSKTLNQPE